MDNKAGIPEDPHDGPPQDKSTKDKIDKHLSDINDTISEQDIKNINTNMGTSRPAGDHHHDIEEADEILKQKPEDDEPQPEAPSPWKILGE